MWFGLNCAMWLAASWLGSESLLLIVFRNFFDGMVMVLSISMVFCPSAVKRALHKKRKEWTDSWRNSPQGLSVMAF